MSTSSSGAPLKDELGKLLGLENFHPLISSIKIPARTKILNNGADQSKRCLRGFAAGEPWFDISLEKGCGLESGEELAHRAMAVSSRAFRI